MDKEPEVLTTLEAAEFLRLSPYAVRDLARRRVLPGREVGRGWVFIGLIWWHG